MNVSDTLQIISALKACGATHFKSQDFEISIGQATPLEPLPIPPPMTGLAQAQPFPEANEEATEKLKGLIETLKMDDSQLIDKIFPAGAGG